MREEWKYGIALIAIILMIVAGSVALNPDSGHSAVAENPVVSAPEFPSAFLPAIMIVGVLGVMLHTRRTQEK